MSPCLFTTCTIVFVRPNSKCLHNCVQSWDPMAYCTCQHHCLVYAVYVHAPESLAIMFTEHINFAFGPVPPVPVPRPLAYSYIACNLTIEHSGKWKYSIASERTDWYCTYTCSIKAAYMLTESYFFPRNTLTVLIGSIIMYVVTCNASMETVAYSACACPHTCNGSQQGRREGAGNWINYCPIHCLKTL